MAEQQVAALAVTGAMARALAARLAEHGYRVRFPPGRDPAAFKVTGLPGGPDVEVTAEDDGWTACHYTGRTRAEAARVIARLPVPCHPQVQVVMSSTLIATWGGIEVEWHYLPSCGCPADPGQITGALLAHLAILDGHRDGKDARR
jgi:hypothetical protein